VTAAPLSVALDEIDWHDGILVEIRLTGLAEERQRLTLVVDLYTGRDAASVRQRYHCVGDKLSRFLISGDVARLVKNSRSGNIDLMRLNVTADTEILQVCLFGGMIEAEAASFQLTEASA
jgi:hypothetical protein